MVNSAEYKTANPKPIQTKTEDDLKNRAINFHDPIIKNKLNLLSCLLISFLFFLIAISGASSGMFRASVTENNTKTDITCGWSNCREPKFMDLYDIDNGLASSGGFFGFVIIIAWIFTLITAGMIYAYLWYDINESFQIKNKLIHHNHIIFYGILIIEILLIIAMILFHYEFEKYLDDSYSKYKWWPTWGMWFTYFAFIVLIIGQYNINDIIIEDVNKSDEITSIKTKQAIDISNNNNNNNINNNNNNNNNNINNINNIGNNNNNNNNNNINNNNIYDYNMNKKGIDDGYESDDEKLGIKLKPNSDTNTIDIEIDDD